jgi:hypothetical protein
MTRAAVKRRTTWESLTPMPAGFNPIYAKRLETMRKQGGGYRSDLVGSPIVVGNERLAFGDMPEDARVILDGNHRYRLAESEGKLDDEVLIDYRAALTRREVFDLRLGIDTRRTVKPAERFIQLREMGDLTKQAISREVELLGFTITHERQDGGLACTNELEWIWARSHAALTQAVISYMAVWGVKEFNSQARVIKGLGAFWIRYPDADIERLATSLRRANVTVNGLYDAGKNEADKLPFIKSVSDGIRYVLAGTYNHGLSPRARLTMP